ncbi:MAG: HAD-IA family hydrolase, partial [Bacteroidota bacterium]
TNAIHQARLRTECAELFACFEHVFFSYEMELRKPDAAIYTRALDEAGMSPSETLFIDDAPKNIAGAEAVGLQTFHFAQGVPGKDWETLMAQLRTPHVG